VLFDSHCHLTDSAFAHDLDTVIERSRSVGVEGIVAIASTPDDTRAGREMAARHEDVWTTAGLHPHEAASGTREALAEVRDSLGQQGIVAVGECGLDYHYDHAPKTDQRRVFQAQVRMAADAHLPIVIHARSCDDDMIGVVADFPEDLDGVLHCFTGSDALLEVALQRGLHVSFTGIVTFQSYSAGHQIAAVPRDRLMVETDAPYLAPVPHRGKRNEPGWVGLVADAVASARGEDPADVAAYTTENARRFYGVE
jgi:TatD DNase family protein